MTISRRRFLHSAAAISLGFGGLRCTNADSVLSAEPGVGFGPLADDPEGLLALPEGFRYTVISRRGEQMTDGFLVPGSHDGMAAFPGPGGHTLLVRNHEVNANADPEQGAFGVRNELLDRLDTDLLYDGGSGSGPMLGGTTNLLFNTEAQRLESHHLSLAGTVRNCAGGPTPWGSWITCEETLARAGDALARDHGYAFEVGASLEGLPNRAVPLTDMGRFNHEAVAVDPASGVVYLTEDDVEGLLYRFVPNMPGELHEGGTLQALALRDRSSFDTRNFGGRQVEEGQSFDVEWIGLSDVGSPDGDLNQRGFAVGAARFAKGEGIWYGNEEVYFACTNGGQARKGQVWRYHQHEAPPGSRDQPEGSMVRFTASAVGERFPFLLRPGRSR